MKINLRDYIWYKFLNSLFFGVSVGSIFIIYTPLEPSIYSLGGIFLAVGMLFVAKWYDVMMNIRTFYLVTLFVEFVVLVFVSGFLVFNYSYMIALSIYIGYQIVFMFGNYLVRMETIALKKTNMLSLTDVAKQKGYLAGMVIAYVFYKLLEYLHVSDKKLQVYDLHVGLLLLQVVIIYFVFRAFKKEKDV
ncbi:hypothetical protein [Sulfurospirillum arcachonense]|uniref:hypothetical protein n=1 Tax=Sulfurospirillum arcachonense TaxID=57666 RepID=UPI000469BC11|nr:hypothetical protein [Sulfurospirillum arcachonense]